MNSDSKYKACIEACLQCASACDYCASACLKEEDIKMMATCIQLDMECSALCYTAAKVMSINGTMAKELCRICAEMCEKCGAECGKHKHEHCQHCAEMCKKCADECRKMAA